MSFQWVNHRRLGAAITDKRLAETISIVPEICLEWTWVFPHSVHISYPILGIDFWCPIDFDRRYVEFNFLGSESLNLKTDQVPGNTQREAVIPLSHWPIPNKTVSQKPGSGDRDRKLPPPSSKCGNQQAQDHGKIFNSSEDLPWDSQSWPNREELEKEEQ